ncbi:EAL domain-containing protein [Novispirillum sp. DQ9]|uniref:EAL domain-containing protein n=1 Tax=Novispirillum sp. DQ9 TaxID=3398612 RepID=UPI003C7E4AF2
MLEILLVEDNEVFARLVEGLLTQTRPGGFAVHIRSDLTTATAAVAATRYDAIVLDLSLPEAEGLETLRRMMAAAPGTPVVVLTALNDEQMALEAVRNGAQDYLIKTQLSGAGLRRSLLYAVERRAVLEGMGEEGGILEGLLNSMYAAAGVLTVVRDASGAARDFRWRLGNAACRAVLGLAARDLVGQSLRDVLPDLASGPVVEGLVRVANGQGSLDIEHAMTRDGAPVWLRVAAAPMGDGVAVTMSDITARKTQETALVEALDKAERADRAKSHMIAALSHGVRIPLNSIIGFAELMENELLGPLNHPQYRAYVKDIAASAHQLVDVVEDLLEPARFEVLARLESGSRQLIDLQPDLICVCRDGIVTLMNAAGAAMVGAQSAQACVGQTFESFAHPDYQPIVGEGLRHLIAERNRVPMKLRAADGREVHVEIAATRFRGDDGADAVLVVARDVTERQIATRAIIQREERLRRIMETMVDGLVIIDERGIIETFNRAAERIFGYKAREVVGAPVNILMPEEEGEVHQDYVNAFLATGVSTVMGGGREVMGRRKDGSHFPLDLALSALRIGDQRLFIGVLRDISERKAAEERLRFLATRDHLTGLPNRAAFRDRLEEALEGAKRNSYLVGVLFIDLDHFKHINDSLGHSVGDRVLQAVGKRLEAYVRPGDTVAHLAGDEFTVILDRLRDPQDAARIASHLLDHLSQPFEVDGREIFTSGSIGIVIYPDNAENTVNLMRNVDTAVNHAKKQGRNTFQFYTEKLSDVMVRRLQIENGLRRALERNELKVVYQPKVDLETAEVIGAEALLRWSSADLGFVSPAEFIPVAEETGLIVPIGEWVLSEVCGQIGRWMDSGRVTVPVAVNLSARQFRQSDLTARITEILERSGISSELLELELTESTLVENADEAIQALWGLKGLGIRLSIDDFGTGYSSLSYLKRFPIDALKVDQSFVRDIPDSMDDMAITKAIISMGRSLDLKLVAEGVETLEQVEFLRANGCRIVQGYYFSKPVAAADFAAFVENFEEEGAAALRAFNARSRVPAA